MQDWWSCSCDLVSTSEKCFLPFLRGNVYYKKLYRPIIRKRKRNIIQCHPWFHIRYLMYGLFKVQTEVQIQITTLMLMVWKSISDKTTSLELPSPLPFLSLPRRLRRMKCFIFTILISLFHEIGCSRAFDSMSSRLRAFPSIMSVNLKCYC